MKKPQIETGASDCSHDATIDGNLRGSHAGQAAAAQPAGFSPLREIFFGLNETQEAAIVIPPSILYYQKS